MWNVFVFVLVLTSKPFQRDISNRSKGKISLGTTSEAFLGLSLFYLKLDSKSLLELVQGVFRKNARIILRGRRRKTCASFS